MNAAQKLNTIRTIRYMAVVIVGILGLYATAITCAMLLRRAVADASLYDLSLSVIFVLICGILITAPVCFLVYHFFSLWGRTTLPKAIRLNKAMRLLHATTHAESIKTLKHYAINVFRAKVPLGIDVTDNVQCKLISTFLSPLFFHSDRLNALGSAHYCCDYDEIQSIIQTEQNKWGKSLQENDLLAAQLVALEKINAGLRQENKKLTGQYTSASGTAGHMKKQLDAAKNHMAVLILLTHSVICEVKPPRTLSREEITQKYLAIAKSHDIKITSPAYVELFRETMPTKYINQGGAPRQG
uniref:hypothetical protein n=1 Tax=uncultured Bilophila sp. TaxID=529385 RepID=UPI0025E9AD70|nr:hypothetical protein [uncultured Bilophila sp.]